MPQVAAASELSELLEEEPAGQGNEVQRLQEHRVLDRYTFLLGEGGGILKSHTAILQISQNKIFSYGS